MRPSAGFLDLNDDSIQQHTPSGHFEFLRHLLDKPANDRLLVPPQHGIVRPRHADIANERRAFRQNLFIRRLHMSVCAENGADLSIQKPSERNLLAGGLRVNVHYDTMSLLLQTSDFRLRRPKRALAGRHEHTSHQVDDRQSVDHCGAAPGGAGRNIERAQHARLDLNELFKPLLIPHVVTAGDHIHARREQRAHRGLGQSRTVRAVFPVRNHNVKPMLLSQLGHQCRYRVPSRSTYHIADEQDFHANRTLPATTRSVQCFEIHPAPTVNTTTRLPAMGCTRTPVAGDSWIHRRNTTASLSFWHSNCFFRKNVLMNRGALLLITLLLALGQQVSSEEMPNILFIVADDLGYADVGFQGCKDIPTPNLDALAAAGVRFTSGYVSGPYCSPTRAGLMTGRYQTRFGHEFNPGDREGLPLSERTIADRLKAAGYVTGLVGKWHLGSQPAMHPQRRGFDEFFGFLGGAHSYFDRNGILRGNEPIQELDYTTDAFGREAAAFIERHKNQPWFLYLSFNAVHTPMHATEERLAKFADIADNVRRTYAAMTLAMDDAVGLVRKTLRSLALDQKTFIMFISDNGGPTMPGVTVNGSRNDPLRGSKRTTLEGGIRVPFVLSWPGRLQSGLYHYPVIQLDATATALAVAGATTDNLDGVNLLPFLTGEKHGPPHDALYWRFGEQMAIRAGDYKLVRYDSNADTRTGARNQPVTAPKLYNLATDVGETKDLSTALPDKVKELQAKWDTWNKLNVTPLWGSRKPTTTRATAQGRKKGRRSINGANPAKPNDKENH